MFHWFFVSAHIFTCILYSYLNTYICTYILVYACALIYIIFCSSMQLTSCVSFNFSAASNILPKIHVSTQIWVHTYVHMYVYKKYQINLHYSTSDCFLWFLVFFYILFMFWYFLIYVEVSNWILIFVCVLEVKMVPFVSKLMFFGIKFLFSEIVVIMEDKLVEKCVLRNWKRLHCVMSSCREKWNNNYHTMDGLKPEGKLGGYGVYLWN